MSKEVRVLFNYVAMDLQTTTAKNLKFVMAQSGSDMWTISPVRGGKIGDIPAQVCGESATWRPSTWCRRKRRRDYMLSLAV